MCVFDLANFADVMLTHKQDHPSSCMLRIGPLNLCMRESEKERQSVHAKDTKIPFVKP